MPYVQIPGAEVYYEEVGCGEPVLFLHSAYSRGILAFAAQFPAFQAQYRCLLPDLRGHGRTRSADLAWTTPQLADDIPAFLDALGIPAAHVIGYSLGGAAALYGVVRYPERFRSLTTIGTAADNKAGLELADDFEPEALERAGQQAFIDRTVANHREAHRGDWRQFLRQSVHNWRLYPHVTPTELATILVPCLFLAGETDPFTGPAQLAHLAQHVPHSRVERIAGCGHRPHMLGNQPELVNDLILRFLQDPAGAEA